MRLFEPERALAALGQVLDGDETVPASWTWTGNGSRRCTPPPGRWRLLDEIDEARPPTPAAPRRGGELAVRLAGLTGPSGSGR
jgi:hypothetical protein